MGDFNCPYCDNICVVNADIMKTLLDKYCCLEKCRDCNNIIKITSEEVIQERGCYVLELTIRVDKL